MPVLYPPETEFAKERCRFEAFPTECGPGKRPFVQHDYPMMMHKAGRPDNGMGAHIITETRLVCSDAEENMARADGFYRKPLEAVEAFEASRLEIAKLAANLDYQKKNQLSPRAVEEVEAAQAKHPGHMPMQPVTPIKPRARKKVKES